MNRVQLCAVIALFFISSLYAQTAPDWVQNLERAYPSRDWVAVTAQGNSQPQAEAAAMNALARAFRTDVASLTEASQRFSQIVGATTSGNTTGIAFNESQTFSQEINTSTNVRGLIGVQIDVYNAPNRTVYVCARMNRRECAARYTGMIRENTAIISTLLASAAAMPDQATFDVYARLSFAHALAQITDNFQNILEVLDSTAASRRPGYGGAAAIRTRMIECAALITIGIAVNTEQAADRTLFTRAAGTFFRDLGFRINEQGQGSYVLHANARFELISQNVVSCRYYLDAALENSNGAAIFSFTENDRKSHPNNASEARRLAVGAVETSFKQGQFAQEFNTWLNSLLN
ncbi:MAG: hypothetical protein LBI14_10375 [Treponema sp.]|jgi:hypothetical protein|nr:hypothetical protein [Treponema sp.]